MPAVAAVATVTFLLRTAFANPECHSDPEWKQIALATLTGCVYHLEQLRARNAPPRELNQLRAKWKGLGYNMEEQDSRLVAQFGEHIRYAVFVQDRATSQNALLPHAVVAVRGTTNHKDVCKFVKLMSDGLQQHLVEVVEQLAGRFGHENVCVAGHSLGAARWMKVARHFAINRTPVEAHLFNPPYASWTSFFSAFLSAPGMVKELYRASKTVLSFGKWLETLGDRSAREERHMVKEEYWALADWMPHLYLSYGDPVCDGYIRYFREQQSLKDNGLWTWVDRSVAPYSCAFLLGNADRADHHIPSAHLILASHTYNPLHDHSLQQWTKTSNLVNRTSVRVPKRRSLFKWEDPQLVTSHCRALVCVRGRGFLPTGVF